MLAGREPIFFFFFLFEMRASSPQVDLKSASHFLATHCSGNQVWAFHILNPITIIFFRLLLHFRNKILSFILLFLDTVRKIKISNKVVRSALVFWFLDTELAAYINKNSVLKHHLMADYSYSLKEGLVKRTVLVMLLWRSKLC